MNVGVGEEARREVQKQIAELEIHIGELWSGRITLRKQSSFEDPWRLAFSAITKARVTRSCGPVTSRICFSKWRRSQD